VDALTVFLATKGYHEKIVGGLAAETTPDLMLLFHPAIRPSVAQVTFEGNKVISETDLQNAIGAVAVGTVYIPTRFRAYLDNGIRPLYEAKGYVRVAFPKITTEKAPDVNGLNVHVQVEEGTTYKLAGLSAPAHPDLLRLAKLAGVKAGDTVDFTKVKAAEDRIERSFRHQGYMHASASVEREIDDKDKTIRLVFNVDPGIQYKFRTLSIQGLDILTEPVIRKMWGLKEGAPYNPDYPQHFLDVVKEEGVLDNLGKTEAQPKFDEDARLVDVTLVFNGAPPKGLEKPPGRGQQQPQPLPRGDGGPQALP
jgi:outer membrane protein insertion porin family